MKLIQFYRDLFLEATDVYEPVWEEQDTASFGYLWHKKNYPLPEVFQIKDIHPDSCNPILIYSIVLPDSYLQTTIYEEIKRYPSRYDLSIVIVNRQLQLNAALLTEKMQDSMMGYLNHARSELMNILDCIIKLPEESVLYSSYFRTKQLMNT